MESGPKRRFAVVTGASSGIGFDCVESIRVDLSRPDGVEQL
jgi:NADP-dependent 3-hydroxy acid dehydrogenase YdfG